MVGAQEHILDQEIASLSLLFNHTVYSQHEAIIISCSSSWCCLLAVKCIQRINVNQSGVCLTVRGGVRGGGRWGSDGAKAEVCALPSAI